MTSYNSQICKSKKSYIIQYETDNFDNYKRIQQEIRNQIDNDNKVNKNNSTKIEIGEYVRTKKGLIRKVKTIYGETDRIKRNNFSSKKETLINGCIKITDIVNHSKDPKDLVQAGDLVYYTTKGLEHSTYIDIVAEHTDARTLEKTLRVRIYKLEQLNIKKILTKEQINENIFKVVE